MTDAKMAAGCKIVILVALVTSLVPHHVTGQRCQDEPTCLQQEVNNEHSWAEVDSAEEGTGGEVLGTTARSEYPVNAMDAPPSTPNIPRTCDESQLKMLAETCGNKPLSCREQCGATFTGDGPDSPTCYCDAACLVYKDCCHDFTYFCMDEVDKYHTNLSYTAPAITSCQADAYPVIENCPVISDKSVSQGGGFEHDTFLRTTDFLVTDSLTGLQFANYSVFSCHRQRDSQAVLWGKQMGSSYSTGVQMTIPDPPANTDIRVCQYFVLKCGSLACFVEAYTRNASALCQAARPQQKYTQRRLTRMGEDQRVLRNETGECTVQLANHHRKHSNIDFSLLVRLSPSSPRSVIAQPFKPFKTSWKEAECDGDVNAKTCRVRQCQDLYYRIGQTCLLPLEMRLLLQFHSASEIGVFNVLELMTLLDESWERLSWEMTTPKANDAQLLKTIYVSYKVVKIPEMDNDQERLPFTDPVLKDIERLFRGDRDGKIVIPENAKICSSMIEYQSRQIGSTLQDLKSSRGEVTFVRDLCDVIKFFDSHSLSDWSVQPDYIKEGMFSQGRATPLQFGCLSVLTYVLSFLFMLLSFL